MKTQSALHLFQYWNRLRAGSPAPQRADIQPSDIRDVLSQIFILQSNDFDTEMMFRVAGTSISNFIGHTLRSTSFRALFEIKNQPLISRLMRNCYQDRLVVVLELSAYSQSGRQTLLELLMLPLQKEDDGGRILGCLVPQTEEFWHGMESIVRLELQSIRVVDPEREPLYLANRPKIEVSPSIAPAEETLIFVGDMPLQKGVQLLVIEGGKSTKVPAEITKR
jgi:hypothetical protein